MSKLARSVAQIQARARILHQRPYHPWYLMPLAEHLTQCGYGTSARNRIVDGVDAGMFLESLVVEGSIDQVDLAGAETALEAGRAWRTSRTLTVEPFMPGADEPDPFDEVLALDAEFDRQDDDAARLDRRIRELVAEWEPPVEHYEPTAQDLADYGEWSEGIDYRAAVREHHMALRTWLTFFPE